MKRPGVGVNVLIYNGNNILFMKRLSNKKLGDNTWSSPGGQVEMFENLETAVKRETAEEVGIKIKNLRFIDVTNDIYRNINKHYITVFFCADYLSGVPRVMEPKKCKEVKWINKNEIPSKLFLPVSQLYKKHKTLYFK